jgi:hypothetical protein
MWQRAEANRREVDPPIQVQRAHVVERWLARLVKERQECPMVPEHRARKPVATTTEPARSSGAGRLVALAVPAVENLTFRSGRECPRVRLLGELQAEHTVVPGNPDFARRLGVAEFVMAPAACSCNELHHPFRVGLSVGIHWREPLVAVVVPGKDDVGVRASKDPPQCI